MTIFKKLLLGVLIGLAFLSGVQSPVPAPVVYAENQESYYVGSVNSNKYHRPTCIWAQKIYPENRRIFKSKEEAQVAVYVPCKVCRP